MTIDFNAIYYICAGACLLVGIIASLVAKLTKDAKKRKQAEEIAEISLQHFKLLKVVKSAMIDTEEHKNFTAAEKLAYCKAIVIDKCINSDIDYWQFDIDEEIENNMELANEINSTKKNGQASNDAENFTEENTEEPAASVVEAETEEPKTETMEG